MRSTRPLAALVVLSLAAAAVGCGSGGGGGGGGGGAAGAAPPAIAGSGTGSGSGGGGGAGAGATGSGAGSGTTTSASPAPAPAPAPLAPAPRIERVQPFQTAPGGQVEVLGSGFSPDPAQNAVTIGAASATVLQAAPDRLVVQLPPGAGTSALRVTVGGAESNAQVVYVPGSRANGALPGAAPAAGNKAGHPSSDGPLLEKARGHEQVYRLRHSPDGLTVNAFLDDPLAQVLSYTNEGDAALWTGTYLAAQAFRHAATGDLDALANAQRALDALHILTDITGVPGLYGRAFFRNSTQYYTGFNEIHDGTGPYVGYRWRGDVSRDQYTGLIFGLAVANDLIPDPAVRAGTAAQLAAMADHFIASGGRIIDIDGQPTTHGDIDISVGPLRLPSPAHALIVLSALKAAAAANPNEPRYAQAYRDAAVGRGYAALIQQTLVLDFGPATKWYNFNLAFQPIYTLLRLETDPVLRQRYEDTLQHRLWVNAVPVAGFQLSPPVRDHFNTFFTFIHAARAPARHGGADWLSVHEAVWSLQLFDAAPHRHRATDGSAFVRPDAIALALFGVDQARDPVPMLFRRRDDFLWQRTPFSYRSPEDLRVEYPGVDYLAGYWMGRYHGFIAPDM